MYVDLLHAMILSALGHLLGHDLRRVGGGLAGPLVAHVAAAGPGDDVPLLVADAEDRVVKGGVDVSHSIVYVLLLTFLALADCRSLRHASFASSKNSVQARPLLRGDLLVGHHTTLALARPCVRLRLLPADGKSQAMPEPPIAPDVHGCFSREVAAGAVGAKDIHSVLLMEYAAIRDLRDAIGGDRDTSLLSQIQKLRTETSDMKQSLLDVIEIGRASCRERV